MKYAKSFALVAVLILSASVALFGQGFEDFDNLNLTGNSYQDGTFIGQDGSEWTYVQCRGDYEITGSAIMIGRNRDPQSYFESGVIGGGVGEISFDYMQAFSTNVNLNIMINDVVVGNVTSTNQQEVVLQSDVFVVNHTGEFVLKFINVNNGDGQVVVDNILWTAYSGSGDPTVSTPVFNPPAGTYLDPISVLITTETEDAVIRYTMDGTDPDEDSPIFDPENPINISDDATLKARGYKTGYNPSLIRTANYEFLQTVEVPDLATLKESPEDGTVYQISSEVVLTFAQSFRNQKFVQDDTAGILIDDNSGIISTQYNVGDGIINLTGTLSTYGNMVQFVPLMDPGAPSSQGNQIVPLVVSMNDYVNDFMQYQSRLIKLESVNFTTADGSETFANGQVYPLSDGVHTVDFRTTFYDVDYIDEVIPTETIDLTGIPNSRSDGDYITPRNIADLYSDTSVDLPFHSSTRLKGNFPNPFNPSTSIHFFLEQDAEVLLTVYNVKGQIVRTLVNETVPAGNHRIVWDGTDNNLRAVPSGVYFYRLDTPNYSDMRKALMLK